ncbi:MAG: hypothetical protein HUJ31_09215, partial [Pseudomonadales bacterium]|nr:hypothetical protein [Pseudomonadales bacterium]
MDLLRKIIPVGLLLLSPTVAIADDDILEEIVVTATRTEQLYRTTPSSVSVVTHEQLMRQTGDQFTDYLTDLPGIIDTSPGPPAVHHSLLRDQDNPATPLLHPPPPPP